MPIYEYECQKCKFHFEVEQKITDQPLTRCVQPQCDGKAQRVVPTTSFSLKGSGWFKTGGY